MSLVKVLDRLKEKVDEKGIGRKQFIENIQYAIDKANKLTMVAYDHEVYNDIINLVALYTAGCDTYIAELLRVLISTYISITKGLNEENREYLKELIFQYFLK